jgi:hypothetical protein
MIYFNVKVYDILHNCKAEKTTRKDTCFLRGPWLCPVKNLNRGENW